MIKRRERDEVDRALTSYFQAEPLPEGFGQRLARRAAELVRDRDRLLERLAVRATTRGVTAIRPGRQAEPASAAARRWVDRARLELGEYLAGKRAFFTVPVDLTATPPFQRKVLEAARSIPFGQARPYAWVAKRIGHPRAVRAVGTALGTNPVPLLVPCHRVLKSDGGVGGYIFGTRAKSRLLKLEQTTPVLEGCTSTRIVCRVGCAHGRRMRADNRVIFASVEDARSVGYRPCRVCRPAAA
ncbi:MAG TPA: methylated-DNA--[protein]-cysteine S-methyltransferase [Candidatus Limnocylindrales bacterium]|nr:methylated-DNA--[protein]-cysteine S-methyltransferase [Candidatus Limnocylindrales bacterium]